jgi:GntR family transcriptional regulator
MSDVATLQAHAGTAVLVDTPSFQPLYQQIKNLLTRQLESGEWRPGESIPSEIDLAARFSVSQGTVRKAIDELAGENILIRRQGKGTFVATHTETQSSMFRFLRVRRNDGQDEYPASELLEVKRVRATADVARALEVPTGEPVLVLRRLLRYGGVPTVLDVQRAHQGSVRRFRRLDVRILRNAIWCAYASGGGADQSGDR